MFRSIRRDGRYLYVAIPLALFILALFSRLYDLSSFPFFKVGSPTCGGLPDCVGSALPGFPGVYDDEATNILAAHSITSSISNFAGGSLTTLIILGSIRILGATVFAVRLPFAVISSVSAIFVYLITWTITRSKILSILSTAYFIIMMPALVYGRMALGENAVALLFLINIYATLRISRSTNSTRGWLLVAALSAAIGTIVKFVGIIIVIYFIVFLFKEKQLRRGVSYILLSLFLGIFLPLGVLELTTRNAESLLGGSIFRFVVEMGNQLATLRYFFLDSLPSAILITQQGLIVPEYWYIFAYVALFALIIFNHKEYAEILLALGVFVAFFAIFSGPFGDYFLIMIQPLFAIAFGPGVKQLALRMPLFAAFAFYAFLYVPLAVSVGEFIITPSQVGAHPIFNNYLFIWDVLVVAPFAALLFFTARINLENTKWRMGINGALLVAFSITLIVATFFLPDLYPFYIAIKF